MIRPYFDSILLFCLIQEFQSIIGEKVKGIKQDAEDNLYIILSHYAFLASTHSSFYRTCLLQNIEKRELRKHPFEDYLKYYNILDIRQLGLDRIFYISFSKVSNDAHFYLLFEITGTSSNIYLLDSSKKIILQHKKTERKNIEEKYLLDKRRTILAKKIFQDIINTESPILELENRFKKLPQWLSQIKEQGVKEKIKESLTKTVNSPKPYIVYKDNLPQFITPIKIRGAKKKVSFSAAVMEFYDYLIKQERKERIKREVYKRIKNLEKTIKKLKEELRMAERSKEFRRKGELILVNLNQIKRGERLLRLKDPYVKNKVIEIELDPSKTLIKNAEEYFKKSKKAERSKKIIEKRISTIRKEIGTLKELEGKTDNLSDEELAEIGERFLTRKIEKAKKKKKKEKKQQGFRTFLTKGGKTVLVGRNRYENERLTFDYAKPKDIFFHIREAPGSHIILVNDGRLSKEDIIEAAQIAAYFSKAKHSTIVPVSYTERRYVRRSKKLGAGRVMLTKEKTIFVEPKGN